VALREWTAQLRGPGGREVLEGYCAILAERAELDRDAVWEWGFLERVSTGLYVWSFGAHRMGRTFLDSAVGLLD
jgi:streptomycin 6-kinase